MNYILQWQQPQMLYWLIPAIIGIVWYRLNYYRPVRYRYSLAQALVNDNAQSHHIYTQFFFLVRLAVLSMIALLIAMPRLIDVDSKFPVEGIDIVLILNFRLRSCCYQCGVTLKCLFLIFLFVCYLLPVE